MVITCRSTFRSARLDFHSLSGTAAQRIPDAGCSTGVLAPSHAAPGTSIVRLSAVQTVVGNQHLPGISVEYVQRQPGRREESVAKWDTTPRRECDHATREPGEDPLLHVVQRFVGQLLLQLAVHGTDVDAKLIGSIGAYVRSEVVDGGRLREEVWDLDVEVVT